MITIHYFASLRESLGKETETIDWQPQFSTLADLKAYLLSSHPGWQQLANTDNIKAAINQAMAFEKSPLTDGDEVAFFPPVTGG